jgi:ubiquinone/menaquinone biosynthesis C-methylase UbiE
MVTRARQTHPSVRFVVADALSLPFKAQKFGIVFSASLINLVSDPVTVLQEMARVCRTGGVLVLLVPAAEFSTAEAKQWVFQQGLAAREAAAYLAWHRLAKKVSAGQIMQWINEAKLAPARVQSHVLLGGLARVVQVYQAPAPAA